MRRRFPRINFKKIFQYLTLVVVTSVILLFVLASLPFTEKYLKTTSLNVRIYDSALVAKQYKADITLESTQLVNKWALINQTKNTLYNRLKKYGVEYVRIQYQNNDDKTGSMLISVLTTKDVSQIQSLLTAKGDLKLLLKKPEANFNDTKNPYAQYMPDNYTETGLTRDDFRDLYVTKLKTTAGEEAYFAIFKPWIWKLSKYDKMLEANANKAGGMNLDGFVTPLTYPNFTNAATRTAKPVLAVGISTDEKNANIQNIVFNSGKIPVGYTYKEASNININLPKYDYYKVFGLAIISTIIASIVLMFSTSQKLMSIKSIVVSGFAFITLVNVAKFAQLSMLSLSLILGIAACVLLSMYYEKSENKLKSLLYLTVVLIFSYYLGFTVRLILFPTLVIIGLSIPLLSYFYDKYTELFLNTIRK